MKSLFKMNAIALNIALALTTGALTVGCAGNSVKQSNVTHQQSSVEVSKSATTSEPAMTETHLENITASNDEGKPEVVQEEIVPAAAEESYSNVPDFTYPDIDISENTQPEQLNFQFGFDKAELSETDSLIVKQHAKFLIDNPEMIINVNGHTDHFGPQAYNEYLSKKRADAVASILIEAGVEESQIHISALANDEPLLDIEHTRMNRRVELNYIEMNFVSAQ